VSVIGFYLCPGLDPWRIDWADRVGNHRPVVTQMLAFKLGGSCAPRSAFIGSSAISADRNIYGRTSRSGARNLDRTVGSCVHGQGGRRGNYMPLGGAIFTYCGVSNDLAQAVKCRSSTPKRSAFALPNCVSDLKNVTEANLNISASRLSYEDVR